MSVQTRDALAFVRSFGRSFAALWLEGVPAFVRSLMSTPHLVLVLVLVLVHVLVLIVVLAVLAQAAILAQDVLCHEVAKHQILGQPRV